MSTTVSIQHIYRTNNTSISTTESYQQQYRINNNHGITISSTLLNSSCHGMSTKQSRYQRPALLSLTGKGCLVTVSLEACCIVGTCHDGWHVACHVALKVACNVFAASGHSKHISQCYKAFCFDTDNFSSPSNIANQCRISLLFPT